MNFLSKNLVYLRKALGVTQQQLALHLKKGQSSLANWENGVSLPNVEDVIMINQYFDISIDSLLLVDLAKSNLIDEDFVRKFSVKNNLNSNPKNNLTAKISPKYAPHEPQLSTVNEPESTLAWTVIELLKGMNQKLDAVQLSVEEIKKSK